MLKKLAGPAAMAIGYLYGQSYEDASRSPAFKWSGYSHMKDRVAHPHLGNRLRGRKYSIPLRHAPTDHPDKEWLLPPYTPRMVARKPAVRKKSRRIRRKHRPTPKPVIKKPTRPKRTYWQSGEYETRAEMAQRWKPVYLRRYRRSFY